MAGFTPASPQNTTSSAANLVTTKYLSNYMLIAMNDPVWAQWVEWDDPIPDEGGPSNAATYNFPYIGELDPAISTLSETADVTPVTIPDFALTLSPAEYGNAVAITKKLKFQSRIKVQEGYGKAVGQNQSRSIDRVIRNGVLAGTWAAYMNNKGARNLLTSSDYISSATGYDYLMSLVTYARNAGIEPPDGSNFVAIVNPVVIRDLAAMPEWKNVGYYQVKDAIYKGEVGAMAGVRFLSHPWGKVYMSGGTAIATTTTTGDASANAAALVAGGTVVTVASIASLAVGDFITIGTLEVEGTEQVQILSIATNTLTIKGLGKGPNDFGFRFGHANGSTITKAPNAAAIPLFGKGSVLGMYGASTGKYGQPVARDGLDILNRFAYLGWYWYGGLTVVNRFVIRGEIAVSSGIYGYN